MREPGGRGANRASLPYLDGNQQLNDCDSLIHELIRLLTLKQ